MFSLRTDRWTDGLMNGQRDSDSRVAFATVNPQELTFLLQCV